MATEGNSFGALAELRDSGGLRFYRLAHLTESGFADAGWGQGVVNANNPARARFGEPPHLPRVARTLGTVFTGVGILGLIGSVLPLFF